MWTRLPRPKGVRRWDSLNLGTTFSPSPVHETNFPNCGIGNGTHIMQISHETRTNLDSMGLYLGVVRLSHPCVENGALYLIKVSWNARFTQLCAGIEECENLATVYIVSSNVINDSPESNYRGSLVYYWRVKMTFGIQCFLKVVVHDVRCVQSNLPNGSSDNGLIRLRLPQFHLIVFS